jgi:chemotaxis family two-component system response regulator PixG
MMCIPKSFNSSTHCRTDFISVPGIDALAHQLFLCSQEQFTGQVDLKIQTSFSQQWSLYFEQGYLVWGTGGIHPVRRWYRHLSSYCASYTTLPVAFQECQFEHWAYEMLVTLLEHHVIHLQSVKQVIQNVIVELLFDLCQQWAQDGYKSGLHMNFKHTSLDPANSALVAIPVNRVWQQTTQAWEDWQQTGLGQYSPNHAPLIWDARRLQQQILSKTYQNLSALMDGQRTLRDLAIKSNNSLVVMAKSLLPYIQQGLINLQEVKDLQPPIPRTANATLPSLISSSFKPILTGSTPLIAYIDDQTDDGQRMEQILSQMGYRFIHIQDSMQALPTLLESKPNLIFLDLVMPIINGYEACAQIRRISKLKDTPVIILTSNDGVIDRVRAKIVGATGFLSKPIELKKIQATLQKLLLTQTPRLDN